MGEFLPFTRNNEILMDPLGTLLPIALLMLIAVGVSQSRMSFDLKRVLYIALGLRAVGALARYMVLFGLYDGSGDAREYYRGGLRHAAEIWRLDFGPLFDSSGWWNHTWYGTQFVYFPSTLVAMFTGPSMLGEFIVFSLFAFAGLYFFIVAFRRSYPHVPATRYAGWICFFPALWFWPSSIGKESIVLLGMGLCTAGYVGRNGRINWPMLVGGMFLIFGIRPQVAAVVMLSITIGYWLSLTTFRWTLMRLVQALVLIAAGFYGISAAMQTEGVDTLSLDGVQTYIEGEGGRYVGGESAIEAVHPGVAGIPMALVNILLRPFPWEAHNPMVFVVCLEILAFWAIVWLRRHTFVVALRHWRKDRLLALAVPFILIYSASLGLVVANMGIIARQRIFIFPFLFLLLEAAPTAAYRHDPPPGPAVRRQNGRSARRRPADLPS